MSNPFDSSHSTSWSGSSGSQSMAGVGRAGFIRDPSGLLMSIIRTLAASKDDHQRELEKERLEEAFSENDQKLDSLVSDNYEEVAVSIKQFGKIGDRISESCTRIKKVKENLQQCKSLLYCRQDELRKLWVEGVEHKRVLFLLDQIETVKDAPQSVQDYLSKKYYLHATELLQQTLSALDAELIQVEALHDIRNELIGKKLSMHDSFITELHRQIYANSITASQKRDRNISVKPQNSCKVERRNSLEEGRIGKFDSMLLELEDLNMDPEEDPYNLMSVLIESLARLNRISDAVEVTKDKMDRHINMLVTHTTVEVTDIAFESENKDSDNPERLLQLLNSLFKKFHCVVSAHNHVLSRLKMVIFERGLDVQLYDIEDVWAKIQSVLQTLLNEYLDVDNASAASQQLSGLGFGEVGSLSSHFTRKKASTPRVAKLFQFDASSHAISMSNYLREQRAQKRTHSIEGSTSHLLDIALSTQKVCTPSPRNITLLFIPLEKFIKEIEDSQNYTGNRKCSLNNFITDYVKDVFIRTTQYELKTDFDAAMKVTDPLKVHADPSVQKSLGNYSCLLQSTFVADQCMWYLYDLTCSLEPYKDHFLTMACSLLQEYKEMSIQSYRGVTQPDAEDQRIMSASWVREADVNEVLRGMNSWKAAYGSKIPKHTATNENQKEAQFFIDKVESELLTKSSLIAEPTDLKAIASLHESLEWMSTRLQKFVTKIKGYAPEDLLTRFSDLAMDYRRMSEICILCIFIELRLTCFYHLIPMLQTTSYDIRGIDSMEQDVSITSLSRDISAAEEQLASSVQEEKFRYLFKGLGSQTASILINGAKYIKRISNSGIKKMCRNVFALQQSFTNITQSRESNLDMARQYYEMLYLMPDDLQAQVVEKGVRYTEEEYVEALNLLHRSKPGSGNETQQMARMQRLRAIVREQTYKKEHAEQMQRLNLNATGQ